VAVLQREKQGDVIGRWLQLGGSNVINPIKSYIPVANAHAPAFCFSIFYLNQDIAHAKREQAFCHLGRRAEGLKTEHWYENSRSKTAEISLN
jgi:hypothetical protein